MLCLVSLDSNSFFMDYEKICIQGFPALKGDPGQELVKQPFLDILPGDKISGVGRFTESGKESSSCRVLEVSPFMTFSGWFYCNKVSYLAFRLPDDGVAGWSLFNPQMPVYVLFIPNVISGYEPELILQNFSSNAVLVYKAVFSLFGTGAS